MKKKEEKQNFKKENRRAYENKLFGGGPNLMKSPVCGC